MKACVSAVLVLIVVGVSVAGPNRTSLYFRDGTKTAALAGTDACTTRWYSCDQYRWQALEWQQWVNPGAVDSARMRWDFQTAIADTNYPDSELDTVRTVAVGAVLDTTGVPRTFSVELLPELSRFIRFIGTGIAGNSNSTNTGSPVLGHDDGK